MSLLVSYDDNQARLAVIVTAVLLALIAYSAWARIADARAKTAQVFERRDAVALLFLIFLAAYFLSPGRIGWGGFIKERLLLIVLVVFLAWAGEIREARWERLFGAIVVAVVLANLVVLTANFRRLNAALEDFTAGTRSVGPNELVLPVFLDGRGESKKVGIFVNAANYYTLDNGNINLADYEAQYDVFPVAYREDFSLPIRTEKWVQVIQWEPETVDYCGLEILDIGNPHRSSTVRAGRREISY
jgi:hypothetical protein